MGLRRSGPTVPRAGFADSLRTDRGPTQESQMKRIQGIWKSLGACALLAGAVPSMAQTAISAADAGWEGGGRSWVATWAAAPIAPGPTTIDTLFKNPDRSRGFENQTIRHIVHTSVGGRRVRVRLSNAFG